MCRRRREGGDVIFLEGEKHSRPFKKKKGGMPPHLKKNARRGAAAAVSFHLCVLQGGITRCIVTRFIYKTHTSPGPLPPNPKRARDQPDRSPAALTYSKEEKPKKCFDRISFRLIFHFFLNF